MVLAGDAAAAARGYLARSDLVRDLRRAGGGSRHRQIGLTHSVDIDDSNDSETSARKRVDVLLVERGLFESRARARAAIDAGGVTADGRPVLKASE